MMLQGAMPAVGGGPAPSNPNPGTMDCFLLKLDAATGAGVWVTQFNDAANRCVAHVVAQFPRLDSPNQRIWFSQSKRIPHL